MRRYRRSADTDVARYEEIDREIRERRDFHVDRIAHERRAREDRSFRLTAERDLLDRRRIHGGALTLERYRSGADLERRCSEHVAEDHADFVAANARMHDLAQSLVLDGG